MMFRFKGKSFEILRQNEEWIVFSLGEGKKSPSGILIPPDISESELKQYLDDLLHEALTPEHPEIEIID